MVDFAKVQEDVGIKRRRLRKSSFKFDREDVANRVVDFYTRDQQSRTDFIDDRIQRYAKYRMWSERRAIPWESASDVALPDLTSDSLRMQDTLHNAVMGIMPPVSADALLKEEEDKQDAVTNLITHQLFNDQPGEKMIGEMAEEFINEGVMTIFIPWVREDRKISDLRILPKIPPDDTPKQYFRGVLDEHFKPASDKQPLGDGWDWTVDQPGEKPVKVSFYTRPRDDKVEMIIEQPVTVFDGPRPMVKDIDEVLHPWRADNLQIPGPSNPGGASHVILIDHPTLDEIKRLKKSGFYDLLTDKEIDEMENTSMDRDFMSKQDQKDDFQGTNDAPGHEKEPLHGQFTRLMCFDMFDVDGDGLAEDVIWWVIKETKTVVKAKLLTEMYPANPPRRPFAESSLIPVKGRRIGISYLELGEGLHDAMKEVMDQTIDSGTLANSPFFLYKSTSLQKPEIITLAPGEGYPTGDPKNDFSFPNLANNNQTFGINMITVLSGMKERLTMVGDLQAGKVPAGKSSALRTSGGMQSLMAQAEARPERILRRFFMGLTEIYHQIHELNQRFLPEGKKVKLLGTLDEGVDPYQEISDIGQIQGRFQFRFKANIFNIDKASLQGSLQNIMMVTMNPLAIQLGISTPTTMYRMAKKFVEAWGQDPKELLNPPTEFADEQMLMAEEALVSILNDIMPTGRPEEGFQDHLAKLQAFAQSEQVVLLEPGQIKLFSAYLERIQIGAQNEAQRQALIQQAQMLQQAMGQQQGQGGQQAASPDMSNPPLNDNENLNREMNQ